MNCRVNDKVTDVELEAIRSKRNEEEQEMSHGLSPEDIVNEQSKMRAVMSGPGPIDDAIKLAQKQKDEMKMKMMYPEDLVKERRAQKLMADLMQAYNDGFSDDGVFPAPLPDIEQPKKEEDQSKMRAVMSGPIEIDKVAQKQMKMTPEDLVKMADLIPAGCAWRAPASKRFLDDGVFQADIEQPRPQPKKEELEKQMKTIGVEYERALASMTAAEAYKSALAAKGALITKHTKENAETARRQQEAERLLETELTRAAHRLQFEIWVRERKAS